MDTVYSGGLLLTFRRDFPGEEDEMRAACAWRTVSDVDRLLCRACALVRELFLSCS
jgi:hypothetical protein